MRTLYIATALAYSVLPGCGASVSSHGIVGHITRTSEASRVLEQVAELARVPFGTAVSVAVSDRGRFSTAFTGTLYAGGPTVDANTPFNVASVSKLLTAAAILELVQAGRLDLDASLARYLPGVHVVDDAGRDRTSDITLRLLLSHRSGLPHQPNALEPSSFGSSWTDAGLLSRLTANWTVTLVGQPGVYRYSNIGYALLGAILETSASTPFAQAMQPVLQGLAMPSSAFEPTDLGYAGAWGCIGTRDSTAFNEPSWYASRYAAPFSGLWTTAQDLAHFGERLNTDASDSHGALHEMARTDVGEEQGIGTFRGHRHGLVTLSHDGGSPGFLAVMIAVPDRQLVLTILCNANGENAETVERFGVLLDRVLDALLGPDQPQ